VTGLVVTGAGVVSSAGIGKAALTQALAAGPRQPPDVGGLYPDAMPYQSAHALIDFDVRALLGRKGTSFLDRATGLALVACGQAIGDSGMVIGECAAERTGIALGTTVGSLRSSSDYSRETLLAERPYLVNPVLFPNTVMNCASGQAAIWYGLKGVNSTVAGGRLGFLSALRYGVNVLRRGYADSMLIGAVEELTPHTAWAHYLRGSAGLPGEAAAVFVFERAEPARAAGRQPIAELAAVRGGFHPAGGSGSLGERLAVGMRTALGEAALEPGQVTGVAFSEADAEDEAIAATAVSQVLPQRPSGDPARVCVRDVLGDCGAAAGALQFAALLAASDGRAGRPGCGGLIAGCTPEGAFEVAVIKGISGVGDRRQ
jgi:3-oxoacyl-[acyl-carrier-protein] synthase II